MRVRHKLTLIFLLLMVSSILVTISFSIIFVRKHLSERRAESLTLEAGRMENYLLMRGGEFWLDDRERAAFGSLFSSSPSLYDDTGVRIYGTGPTWVPATGSRIDKTGVEVVKRVAAGPVAYVRLFHPRSDLDAELAPIRWIIYYAMFLSTVLVCVFGVLFAYYVTRPLVRVSRAAANIEAGESFAALADVRRKDELGTLARAIETLSSKLHEENLRLKRLHDQQTRFYADVTHEIANPVHNLLTTVEVMEIGGASPKYLAALRSNAERLIRLFNDMLTLVRYDSDPGFIQKSRFDLQKPLNETYTAYLPSAEAKGLTLKYTPATTSPLWVSADERRIAQVLDNLVSNAVKYTAEGTVELFVADAGGWLRVGVRDTGPGIEAEHVARLTDRFYRTEPSRSRQGGGTGLGLAVVHSILRAHGASLDIDTAPGNGATFSFLLAKA